MEDPSTWGEAERVVKGALAQAAEADRAGVYGLSLVRQITDALRGAGLLLKE